MKFILSLQAENYSMDILPYPIPHMISTCKRKDISYKSFRTIALKLAVSIKRPLSRREVRMNFIEGDIWIA
jgi:hypothetical protein